MNVCTSVSSAAIICFLLAHVCVFVYMGGGH